MPTDLTGQLAIVTGGRTGRLGPIWTNALIEAGADVVTFDLPEQDVTDDDSIRAFLDALPQAPAILVNNAGIDSRPTMTNYDWMTTEMARVNLLGTDRMTRHAFRYMAASGGGAIINIASLYGLVSPDLRYYDHREDGWVKDPMYGATKAGVISLTRYYAAKFGEYGVRVNALAPGGVVADGDGLTAQDPQFVGKYTSRIPMGRMCTPADLAGPLVFLASAASSFVTGQVIALDGGYLCW
jgi:NAD(P)-dependent dehydrogenase (short-subunit alcohol dehydrogenase family)